MRKMWADAMKQNDSDFLKEVNQEIGTLVGQEIQVSDLASVNRRGLRESGKKVQVSRKALTWIIVLSLLVVLVGGTAGAYFIIREQGRRSLEGHIELGDVPITAPEDAVVADGGVTITWNGKTYTKNSSVINILCMGIDKTASDAAADDEAGSGAGQADTVILAALDTETGKLTLLNLSRDSMTDVDVYNIDGEFVETSEMQLCLAYAYGDGADSSCLNVVKAASRLMYGVPVDAYVSLDLPAVSILNDAVGGVEVTVLEDLSSRDSALKEGARVLLQGNQAEIYVRSRNKAELASNNQRMARQRQYAAAFVRKAFSQIREDWSVTLTLYQAAQVYSNVSLRLPEILYLVSVALKTDFSEQNIITIPGEVVMGDEFAEYYVDEDVLFQTIIDTYYQEVS